MAEQAAVVACYVSGSCTQHHSTLQCCALCDDTLWRHDLQSLGQKPITFYRQVLALCEYPQVSKGNFVTQAEHQNLQATPCRLSS